MGYAEFYRRSIEDRDAFWAEQARLIDWQQPPRHDLRRTAGRRSRAGSPAAPPTCATTRWTATWRQRADQPALIYVSTETGAGAHLHLPRTACRGAARWRRCCRRWACGKGDRVLIYMPMIAEAAFAMLACARIGAIHSVVFGGFASVSLASRIEDATPKRDRQRRRRLARRQGAWRTSRCWTRRSGCRRHKPESVLLVDRGLAPMEQRGRPRPRLGRRCAERHQRRRGAVRVAGLHRHQLHHLHQRHHRPAQGRAARRRRLRRGAGRQHEAHLPGRAGRDLLLHQRHRLGGGPQLHRLRPADRRHGDHHVRGPADPPGRRRLVEPGREVQGHARCSARRRRCACSRSRTRPS